VNGLLEIVVVVAFDGGFTDEKDVGQPGMLGEGDGVVLGEGDGVVVVLGDGVVVVEGV
jgi:hypothetical protein